MATKPRKVLVIGSGPIVIGQAAEFDYSGSQALKALREEGIKTVLINSNPATIQTDPDLADRVYIEPLTPEFVEAVIKKEKPDEILSSLGGQTGLNLVSDLAKQGILKKYKLTVLGTPVSAINTSEDRSLFKKAMEKIGEPVSNSEAVTTVHDALLAANKIGYPIVVRPAYTLGGTGGGIATDQAELEVIAASGLAASPVNQILVEEYLGGWKEVEYEVMRDSKDNCITICNMENFDPMGIHTGESIVVAPSQTLSDREYQMLRSASLKIIRALNVHGGCNIQFALSSTGNEYRIIEVNPRVSRSSALASKATGYPIAFISAKVAVGRTLDELPNPITQETTAAFEPALDYIVVKIPRWPFEKFPLADKTLGTQMKSTGEVMAIGRTFEEALEKAVRSLDIGVDRLSKIPRIPVRAGDLEIATHKRLFHIVNALRTGWSIEKISGLTKITPWFLEKIKHMLDQKQAPPTTFKMVDTCAAEFEAKTPYYYRTAGTESEHRSSKKKKIIILGSGPIRIGQGIEFDYCTVHAVQAIRNAGVDAIVVNSNPETVSTDYDTANRLYFDPVALEDVLHIARAENAEGVITQFGGQTAVNLSLALEKNGLHVLGTTPKDMDRSEDRREFTRVLRKLNIPQAKYGLARTLADAKKIIQKIGYPVLVRPSYVLGGRAMEIVYEPEDLEKFVHEAVKVSQKHPILIDEFLSDAIEVDVDAVSDGHDVLIGGIMEHIEQAGVHSGDSSCVTPPQTLSKETVQTIKKYTRNLAREMNVHGLLNIQYAVKQGKVYALEANPRSSRTVPFISKATGTPLAKIAARVILGEKLQNMKIPRSRGKHISVKSVVFPFNKIPGSDARLGPEMKSTGESMGIAPTFEEAYYKAQLGAGVQLPAKGTVFFAVRDADKAWVGPLASTLSDLGFRITAVGNTAKIIRLAGCRVQKVLKVSEGRPNIVDLIREGKIQLVINTPTAGGKPSRDGYKIRRACIQANLPCITTLAGAQAAAKAIRKVQKAVWNVHSLQTYHS